MYSKALCIGTSTCQWENMTLATGSKDVGFLSLLIDPLTGYARILNPVEDTLEMERCAIRGFLIAETLPFGNGFSRWQCQDLLSQRLKRCRADLEWVNAVEDLAEESKPDLLQIPRGSEQDFHEKRSMFKSVALAHRYLCSTISGD